MMEKKICKKYSAPKLISQEVLKSSKFICGWFTQCGKQVQYDK